MRRHGPLFLLCLLAFGVRADETKTDEAPAVDPKEQEKAVARIREEYEAIDGNHDLIPTRRRRELARRLGTIPHEDSVKLLGKIVERDSDLRTQIYAMHSLADVGDIDALKRMFRYVQGKGSRTVLPDYLGPVLAHAKAPETGQWIADKLLRHGNRVIRLSGIEALGELRAKEGREPLLQVHAKLAKNPSHHRNIHAYYELVRALGLIGGPGVREIMFSDAENEDWRIRLAVAEVLLAHQKDDEAVAVQRKLLKDEKPIVRELAATATGKYKVEALFPELSLLLREGNLRAKEKSVDAMRIISGVDYGYAPEAWEKWWEEKQKGNLSEAGKIKAGESVSIATYYNFKIFSDRVLFVVDVSGSMKWPDYTPNRIQVATRELLGAVKALDEKTLFNLATFAGHWNIWQKKGEVPATDRNKERAREWIQKNLLPRGATNTYEALMRSLSDNPLVDTVYFLSDGIPSAGKFELPEEIVIKLRYENRFRKVIFHTVALAFGKAAIESAQKYEDPDEMADFMRMIAEFNGGTCVDIRKPLRNLREDR